MPGVFAQTFSIPEDAIDELGHVSNLKYIAWMQDIAIQHSAAKGWPVERYLKNGAVWVVRSHSVTYIRPAFAGETITLQTWVAGMKQRSSLRAGIWSGELTTSRYWWRLKPSGSTWIAKAVDHKGFRTSCERV